MYPPDELVKESLALVSELLDNGTSININTHSTRFKRLLSDSYANTVALAETEENFYRVQKQKDDLIQEFRRVEKHEMTLLSKIDQLERQVTRLKGEEGIISWFKTMFNTFEDEIDFDEVNEFQTKYNSATRHADIDPWKRRIKFAPAGLRSGYPVWPIYDPFTLSQRIWKRDESEDGDFCNNCGRRFEKKDFQYRTLCECGVYVDPEIRARYR